MVQFVICVFIRPPSTVIQIFVVFEYWERLTI